MNCHRVQSLLSAYLDQELSPEEWRLIRTHIYHCPACAKNYEDLSSIKNHLGNLEPPTPQVDLVGQFLFHHFHGDSSFPTTSLVWGKRLAFSAACVFLFLLTAFYLFPVEQGYPMVASQEASPFSINPSTSYQLVSEHTGNANLFLEEDEDKEGKMEEWEYYFLPDAERPLSDFQFPANA